MVTQVVGSYKSSAIVLDKTFTSAAATSKTFLQLLDNLDPAVQILMKITLVNLEMVEYSDLLETQSHK